VQFTFVAVTVKVEFPTTVGTPERSPEEDRVNPAGSVEVVV